MEFTSFTILYLLSYIYMKVVCTLLNGGEILVQRLECSRKTGERSATQQFSAGEGDNTGEIRSGKSMNDAAGFINHWPYSITLTRRDESSGCCCHERDSHQYHTVG